jgi:hypothetical protein
MMMALATLIDSKLHLVFEVGVDEQGHPVYKSKTFNNLKKEATTDQLFQTADALSVLCNDRLNTVERIDSSDIIGG